MAGTIIQRTALRRGTAAAWTSANPVLAAGEEGYETDTRKRKVGNGTSTWAQLAYDVAEGTGTGSGTGTGTVAPTGSLSKFVILASNAGVYPTVTRPANTVFEFQGPNDPGALMNTDGDTWVQTAS